MSLLQHVAKTRRCAAPTRVCALPCQARRASAELQAQLDEARSQRDEQRTIVAHLHTESAGDKHQLETLREQLAELRAQLNSAAEGSKARANQQSKVRCLQTESEHLHCFLFVLLFKSGALYQPAEHDERGRSRGARMTKGAEIPGRDTCYGAGTGLPREPAAIIRNCLRKRNCADDWMAVSKWKWQMTRSTLCALCRSCRPRRAT